MKLKTIYFWNAIAFCQSLVSQTSVLHQSINFNNINDGHDFSDGIIWYKLKPIDYEIYSNSINMG